MSSMLKRAAPSVPMTVTTAAIVFPFPLSRPSRDSAEMPADQASRKVVVTVERIRMIRAATPRPAFAIIPAMSDWPVNSAAPSPITYIQTETRP